MSVDRLLFPALYWVDVANYICIAIFKELSECKAVCDVNLVKFQSKGSKDNTLCLGLFRRIIKVEKCVKVIGTLNPCIVTRSCSMDE